MVNITQAVTARTPMKDLYLQRTETTYMQISRNLEAARYCFKDVRSDIAKPLSNRAAETCQLSQG